MTGQAAAGAASAPAVGEQAPTVHLIGNAHIDPVWVWDWREGFGEVWATFRSALDRLAEYPDAVFTASSAAHHAWIEEHDPAMFAEIRAAVDAGRWCLVGGMWVEPDCNLPSGESLCRQLLLGQRYFQRAFGHQASVGYNIDSFGHAAGLPQLLAKSGLGAYVMMRPGETERPLPAHLFRWSDPSGSEVVTYRIPFEYGTDTAEELCERVRRLTALTEAEGRPMMCFYGVGNHGGGPTRSMLERAESLRAAGVPVAYGDPTGYFSALGDDVADLPLVEGELQHHAVGCYSVSAWVKVANRRAEAALLDAETLTAVAAGRFGGGVPAELELAWRELALCQFHDVLAGTSSEAAYRGIRARFGYVETVADRLTTSALYGLAHRVDTRSSGGQPSERASLWSRDGGGFAYVVFNPLGWPVRQLVALPRSADRVTGADGRALVAQAIASGEVTAFPSHTLVDLELGPLGYETLRLEGGRWRRPAETPEASTITGGLLTATVEPGSGALQLAEAVTGRALTGEGGIRPVVLADESDTWSHGIAAYAGAETALDYVGSEVVEDGPLRWTIRVRFATGASRLSLDASLVAGAGVAELRLRADWAEPYSVVKLVLPWRLGPATETVAGAAYSHQPRRPTGDEEPFQGWLDCYDPDAGHGIGLTTDHLSGYDAEDARVRLTILRNPLAADHGGRWADRLGEDYPFTDSGPHEARVWIHPHAGDWRSAGLPALSEQHRRPPIAVAEAAHTGSLPASGSFLDLDGPAGVLRAVKRAEEGTGVVLRLVGCEAHPTPVVLGGPLLGREVRTTLGPFEVQTLLVPDDAGLEARPVPITELE